ncbi:MAG: dephospho-CoA kinase [Thiobacillaceae bacterium]|jgi:dephospho-CoA kinase
MLVVGLTGGIGSGKTTVANLFSEQGVPVIDTDRISHDLTASGGEAMPLIEDQFGEEFVNPDGSLNRQLMRHTVFGDSAARKNLEAILHPMIRQAVEAQLGSLTTPYVIVVIPLLLEKGGYDDLVHRVLVVDCGPDTQISRTMTRNKLNCEEVQAILDVQVSRQHRLGQADDVIVNEGNPDGLKAKIRALNEKYISLSHVKP